jgi:hypothetical protein
MQLIEVSGNSRLDVAALNVLCQGGATAEAMVPLLDACGPKAWVGQHKYDPLASIIQSVWPQHSCSEGLANLILEMLAKSTSRLQLVQSQTQRPVGMCAHVDRIIGVLNGTHSWAPNELAELSRREPETAVTLSSILARRDPDLTRAERMLCEMYSSLPTAAQRARNAVLQELGVVLSKQRSEFDTQDQSTALGFLSGAISASASN